MSEKMYPIPFQSLMQWMLTEYRQDDAIFGINRFYRADPDRTLPIFGEAMETPFGPAAGPNTQLAQNIISAYLAGARFFELKTVQTMDGAELAACIPRPCILAEDEGYNAEWSTELTVPQAYDEYVKAWCALKILSRRLKLGGPDGFIFNMSVGYDLTGIRSEKIDRFIEGLKDASHAPIFAECKQVLTRLFPEDADYIAAISPRICCSVTLSTLHGCPPEEIERIASYLLTEKHLHTFVKCNPTILGYQDARSILDAMGFDYVSFDDHHFREDLQYQDAVPMFRRLQALAAREGLEFGLKLSNTFPAQVKAGELPAEEMYMSGRSLFPLTIEMATRLSREFGGKLRISYSGGADFFSVQPLFRAGVWPITMATTILKPGGYQRLTQLACLLDGETFLPFSGTDPEAIAAIGRACRTDPRYHKPAKPASSRKSGDSVPWLDCFSAPCKGGCPLGQDIPEYLELCRKGLFNEALELIVQRNPLPFITGTICAHRCMGKCSRNFYDDPVHIRAAKRMAAERGYNALMSSIRPPEPVRGKRAAILGGGPAGMAAAFFLGRAGIPCTIFEREASLGGVVRHVIPAFRIPDEIIDRDTALIRAYGAEIRLNTPAPSIDELRSMGYTHILVATGAWKPGRLDIPGHVRGVIQWMQELKSTGETVQGSVAVIGGGNTAMDAARLAKRSGADRVTLVYRRTRRYMPADPQELELALQDGVELLELAAPLRQEDGRLLCCRMALGEPDASGRRSPVPTGETLTVPCDLVISAVGEQVDGEALTACGIPIGEKGRPAFHTGLENVYAAGDVTRGPATVAEAIADAARFAEAVIGESHTYPIPVQARPSYREALSRKGVLRPCTDPLQEGLRCLDCQAVCQTCADVCPNRANVVIHMPGGRPQILHVDKMCNECGNCTVFCPYASAPCKDKLTLFQTRQDMDASENCGFLFLPDGHVRIRTAHASACRSAALEELPAELLPFIACVRDRYAYLYREN